MDLSSAGGASTTASTQSVKSSIPPMIQLGNGLSQVTPSNLVIEDPKVKANPGMLVLSPNGTLLAVMRKGGKYIHIVDMATRKAKVELYRGMAKKEVRSISISGDNNYLGLITGEDRVHIFYIGPAIRSKFYDF